MTLPGRWIYTLILLVSLAVAAFLVRKRQNQLPLSRSQRLAISISAFLGAMLGAKLPFVFSYGWEALFSGVAWFLDGKTILGGIVGGYLAVELAKWIFRIQTRTGDSFALPVAMAVGIGRIGCFMEGCCYGKITDVAWGVHFESAQDQVGVLRHPTQIYEAGFHFLAACLLMVAYRRKWVHGNQLKAYLLAYLVFRFTTEWLRPEPSVLLNLTIYQVACILLIVVLVILWRRDRKLNLQPQVSTSPTG